MELPAYIKVRRYVQDKETKKWSLKDYSEYILAKNIVSFYPEPAVQYWIIRWRKTNGLANRYYLVEDKAYTHYFESYINLKDPHLVDNWMKNDSKNNDKIELII